MVHVKHGEVLLVSENPELHAEWFDQLSNIANITTAISLQPLTHQWYEPDLNSRLILFDYKNQYFLHEKIPHVCIAALSHAQVALINADKSLTLEQAALEAGLSGVFHHNESDEVLIRGILAIFYGQPWYRRRVMSNAVKKLHKETNDSYKNKSYIKDEDAVNLMDVLTRREKKVLELMDKGLTYQEIADRLFISQHTVKVHARRIFKKTGVRNRVEAVCLVKKYKDL